jgi:hypothetical protein
MLTRDPMLVKGLVKASRFMLDTNEIGVDPDPADVMNCCSGQRNTDW